MVSKADTLRRRIQFYRRRLKEGVESELARIYLLEIGSAELELAELERGEPLLRPHGRRPDRRLPD